MDEGNEIISDVFEKLNIVKLEYRQLILAGLTMKYLGIKGEMPIFWFTGPPGSGKTLTAGSLASILAFKGDGYCDSDSFISGPPKDEDDIVALGRNLSSFVFDNMHDVNERMSDIFCRVSSGSPLPHRKFHTQDKVAQLNETPLIFITGVSIVPDRPDLLDRSVVIPFDERKDYRSREKFKYEWGTLRKKIVALLELNKDKIIQKFNQADEKQLSDKSRLVDFQKMGIATSQYFGFGDFNNALKVMTEDRQSLAQHPVMNVIAIYVIDKFLIENKDMLEYTAGELLERINNYSQSKYRNTLSESSVRLGEIGASKRLGIILSDYGSILHHQGIGLRNKRTYRGPVWVFEKLERFNQLHLDEKRVELDDAWGRI